MIPIEPEQKPITLDAKNLAAWATNEKSYVRVCYRVANYSAGFYLHSSFDQLSHAWLLLAVACAICATIHHALAAMGLAYLAAVYALTDVLEDLLIFVFMTRQTWISDRSVDFLALLRNVKISSNAMAMVQLVVLSAVGALWS